MIPDLVMDVGFHVGDDTNFYLKKGFRVVAVEANPALAKAGEARFADAIADGRLALLNVGISDGVGERPFYVNRTNADWSSFLEDAGGRGGDYEVVSVMQSDLTSIVRDYGTPYYIKIDIEGHDDLCIRELEQWREYPKFVSVEGTVLDFFPRMAALGYRRFKVISQLHHQHARMQFPPLEGEYVWEQTTGFSSGPFGDETYGRWMTLEEVEAEWALVNARRFDETVAVREWGLPVAHMANAWFDLHARLSD